MKQGEVGTHIAYVLWSENPFVLYYVAQVKGDGGVDWGYTTSSDNALPLNTYWQRRFRADQKFCGRVAVFTPV